MKKSFVLALLLSSAAVQAASVGSEQALLLAERTLGKRVQAVMPLLTRSVGHVQKEDAYYVFNAVDGRGFAIVSADDAMGEVLAYSQTDAFPSGKPMPCALQMYLEAFSEAAALGTAYVKSSSRADAAAFDPVQLCTTEWGQGAPYNTLCPQKDGYQCPSGCVATALAQLLYYWKWPVQGVGYSWAKDGNGETYSGTLEHTYAWSAMRNTTAENKATEEAAQAVAQLMYDCGLSVNMNYDTDGSGARTPVNALYKNFGYLPETMRMYQAECFTGEEWFAMLRNEVAQKRPVYYTATSLTNGGKDAAGHAFIVDGYDAQGRVHVNWGWDGDFNGYFDLAKMNPGGYQFTINQAAIVGLQPARNGETGTPEEYLLVRSPLVCNQKGTIQKTLSFSVTVSNVWNLNGSSHTWQLSLGLFDVRNEMVAEVKSGRVPALSLDPGYGMSSDYASINCSLKSSYPDGDYAIRLIFRESGTDEWLLPDMVGGLKANAVYVRLNGTKVTFTDGKDYIATGILDIQERQAPLADDVTRVYDASGRMVYSSSTDAFNLWDVPAQGILVVKQGDSVRKIAK